MAAAYFFSSITLYNITLTTNKHLIAYERGKHPISYVILLKKLLPPLSVHLLSMAAAK